MTGIQLKKAQRAAERLVARAREKQNEGHTTRRQDETDRLETPAAQRTMKRERRYGQEGNVGRTTHDETGSRDSTGM